MKRTISLILSLSLLTTLFVASGATTAAAAEFGDFSYIDNGTSITITDYTGPGGPVTVPSQINGKPVTAIGDNAFYFCTFLASVTLPDTITSIGDNAFSETYFMKINIPSGVTSIGNFAFAFSSIANISLPSTVTSIGDFAFNGCGNLQAIDVAASNQNYSSIDGVLFNKSQTELLQCPGGKKGTYSIPAGVMK